MGMDTHALWEEYESLQDAAKSEFSAIRELPLYGRKQWAERFFQRAFKIYSNLWTFQQEHRCVKHLSSSITAVPMISVCTYELLFLRG